MIREDGRWGGRLTSRPLPESDADLDQLADDTRRELADIWLARAATEARVAGSFEVIHRALMALRAEATLTDLAHRAIDDEHRHAEMCRVVASRFAGRPLEQPAPLPLVIPKHREASDELRHSLHVIGQCAMNETFASAFLEACVDRTSAPLARAATRELLSDEIDHARLGWAHIATLSTRKRREVEPWLLHMTKANLKMWRETPRPHSGDATLIAHGAPLPAQIEDALRSALVDLIIPGFLALGFDTAPLQSWAQAGAPTADASSA